MRAQAYVSVCGAHADVRMRKRMYKHAQACVLRVYIRGRAVPGMLPAVRERESMMGMKMPPARAVVEGMAGAISASARDRP